MTYGTCNIDTKRYAEQPTLDWYSVGHAVAGVAYGAVGYRWYTALVWAVAWEAIENPLKDEFPGIFPDACRDTLPNAIGDVAGVMLGWSIGSYIRRKSERTS